MKLGWRELKGSIWVATSKRNWLERAALKHPSNCISILFNDRYCLREVICGHVSLLTHGTATLSFLMHILISVFPDILYELVSKTLLFFETRLGLPSLTNSVLGAWKLAIMKLNPFLSFYFSSCISMSFWLNLSLLVCVADMSAITYIFALPRNSSFL